MFKRTVVYTYSDGHKEYEVEEISFLEALKERKFIRIFMEFWKGTADEEIAEKLAIKHTSDDK